MPPWWPTDRVAIGQKQLDQQANKRNRRSFFTCNLGRNKNWVRLCSVVSSDYFTSTQCTHFALTIRQSHLCLVSNLFEVCMFSKPKMKPTANQKVFSVTIRYARKQTGPVGKAHRHPINDARRRVITFLLCCAGEERNGAEVGRKRRRTRRG